MNAMAEVGQRAFAEGQLPELLHIGRQSLSVAHTAEHIHPLYAELLYVLEGHGRCILSGREWEVHPRDCILCGAYVPHTVYSTEDTPLLCYSLDVYNLSLGNCPRNQFTPDAQPVLLHLPADSTLPTLLHLLEQETRPPQGIGNDAAAYLTAAALATVWRWQQQNPAEDGRHSPELSRRVRDYIDANYCSALTLDGIAGALGVSPFHMSRVFHQRVGCTPVQYITRLRIARAKTMLAATDKPIRAVAVECGYGNINYFHTLFRRMVGMTPARYRRMVRGDSHPD